MCPISTLTSLMKKGMHGNQAKLQNNSSSGACSTCTPVAAHEAVGPSRPHGYPVALDRITATNRTAKIPEFRLRSFRSTTSHESPSAMAHTSYVVWMEQFNWATIEGFLVGCACICTNLCQDSLCKHFGEVEAVQPALQFQQAHASGSPFNTKALCTTR